MRTARNPSRPYKPSLSDLLEAEAMHQQLAARTCANKARISFWIGAAILTIWWSALLHEYSWVPFWIGSGFMTHALWNMEHRAIHHRAMVTTSEAVGMITD